MLQDLDKLRQSQTEGVKQLLFASAIISWIGYLGLFIWLSYSVFPFVTAWLSIIFR